EAASPGRLDELRRAARLLDPVPRDEMGDLKRYLTRGRDPNRLCHRVGCPLVTTARVGRVEASAAGEHAAELGHLVLGRARLLRVLEAGRVAPRSLRQRF